MAEICVLTSPTMTPYTVLHFGSFDSSECIQLPLSCFCRWQAVNKCTFPKMCTISSTKYTFVVVEVRLRGSN